MKGKENLICGKVAVGRNYNLTRDIFDGMDLVQIVAVEFSSEEF